jgi:hypothetical protein
MRFNLSPVSRMPRHQDGDVRQTNRQRIAA